VNGVKYFLVLYLSRPFVFGAAFAGFVLLVALATLPSLVLLNLKFLEKAPIVGTPWFYVLATVVVVVSGVFGIAVARFALRLVPIRFGEQVQVRAYLIGLCILLPLMLFAYHVVFPTASDSSSNTDLGLWYQSNAPEAVRIAGAIAVIVFAACVVAPFLWRHMRPRAFLNRPFVLYLRRFSTFSDRSVMNDVLRACPYEKPLVFLIPTRGAIRDWNPFQIGLAGLRIRNPFKSLPICVRADDATWQKAARKLIDAAEVIVLDASEGSDSIAAETKLIESLEMWHKTVVLRAGQARPADSAEKEPVSSRSAQLIHYERNWRRAIARLIIGPWASMFPAIVLASVGLVMADRLLMVLGLGSEDGNSQRLISEPKTVLALFVVLAVWIYIVLFWRPAINKEAAVTLANRLGKTPQTGTP
jgi:hypothetical protein